MDIMHDQANFVSWHFVFQSINHFWTFNAMLWAVSEGAIITAGKYSKLLSETKALLSFEITLFCTNFLFGCEGSLG